MNTSIKTSLFALALGVGASLAHAEERVLFAFDDHSIPWQHNLKVTLVPATKHPENPVLRRGPEGSPDHGHAILYGTVIKDGGKFRMWYLGMIEPKLTPAGDIDGRWRPMCYAESTDGVHWTKPELGLVELNGNKRNNICLIEGEPFSMTRVDDFLSVLYEPNDPDPAKRYKAVYIAHPPYSDIRGGMSKVGIKARGRPYAQDTRLPVTVCATSADGLRWKIVGDRPANAGGEFFEVSGLYRFGDFYYTSGQHMPPWGWRADGSGADRIMMCYRSSDFMTWSHAKALAFARPGQLINPRVPGQQTHMGAGLWNRGNVMLGLYGMWQDGPKENRPKGKEKWGPWDARVELGLIVSNDGVHFREPVPDFKVIARGNKGEWDDMALLQAHAFVNEGDQTMIWYSHWDTNGGFKDMDIGLATLRRDGFGYLSVQESAAPASCETVFFDLSNDAELFLNVDGVTADAPLKIELLDEHLKIVRSGSVGQSGLRVPALALSKGRAAVRVSLPAGSSAKLYALYLND